MPYYNLVICSILRVLVRDIRAQGCFDLKTRWFVFEEWFLPVLVTPSPCGMLLGSRMLDVVVCPLTGRDLPSVAECRMH